MKEGFTEEVTLAGPFCQEEGCLQYYQEGSAAWSLEGVILTCQ